MLDLAIAEFVGSPPPLAALTPDSIVDLRAGMTAAGAALRGPELPSVMQLDADGVPARLYRPNDAENLPLLVFLHGGAWILGNLDTHDAMCRILAARSGSAVLAVDYRLAPEHPFPAGLDDIGTAWGWACRNASELGCDPHRLALGGESAGANLAAALTLKLRDRGLEQPLFQLLVHPPTDLRMRLPSFGEIEVPGLDRAFLKRCVSFYAREADLTDPLLSPLRADRFDGLPPAIVVTAECDPLRDDGEYYAESLAAAGVATACRRLAGLPHGFMFLPENIPAVSNAFDTLADMLRNAFAGKR